MEMRDPGHSRYYTPQAVYRYNCEVIWQVEAGRKGSQSEEKGKRVHTKKATCAAVPQRVGKSLGSISSLIERLEVPL